ncbi:MAG: diaminopimelate decarboxylase [Spirochaetales bacterium]|nr:diaminopimelate decarboxylase [Spirochaetales bacterium]
MAEKNLPCSEEKLQQIAKEYGTPFHIYDEKAIRENAKKFIKAFDWVPGGFKNYFAVKALPNPHIMKILKDEGMGADCSSLPELVLAKTVGITDEDIMFTSNDTPAHEYREAIKMGAIVNLDDISHINFIEKYAEIPELVCFRYNPGNKKKGNKLIGNPEDAKYGFTYEDLLEGYRILKEKGVKRFGLHTMVASNELNPEYFVETAKIVFDIAVEVKEKFDINFEFVNLGGGIGIPYKPEDSPVDLNFVSQGIKSLYEETIVPAGLAGMRIVMECGRMVTGPYGYLVTTVLHRKETYKKFVGLDATMANLMRPALYGAYHHITVLGKAAAEKEICDVTGSLCENNDKFAVDREIPHAEPGDIVVIHDTGAHGHAMGFNYNAKLRSKELLLKPNGNIKLIRRAETIEDYFATLDFTTL